ncbi:MAG: DUF3990 domain-containing protein [Oscillospiraceae bacterium]|nr:DUF3990 domain-containing protein [Oscillospiraceae bacterium]
MVFYHGTNSVIGSIDLNKCRLRTDFGRGFYISSNLETAQVWADGKAGFSGISTIMRYKINDSFQTDNIIKYISFDKPSEEWLDFIRLNRQRYTSEEQSVEPRHTYDIVSGPIANDKVVDVVDLYLKQKITAEVAISRLKALPSVMQLSFHTPLAMSYILSSSYSQRNGKKWSGWKNIT